MNFPSEKILAPRPAKPRPAEPEEADPQTLGEFIGEVRDSARFVAEFSAELARLPLPENFGGDGLYQVAQALFEADVIRRRDLKNHVLLHRLRQADRSINLRAETLALSRERFHFDAAELVLKHFAEIKSIHDNGTLPHPEKITALRRLLFAALPVSGDDPDPPASTEDDPVFA